MIIQLVVLVYENFSIFFFPTEKAILKIPLSKTKIKSSGMPIILILTLGIVAKNGSFPYEDPCTHYEHQSYSRFTR